MDDYALEPVDHDPWAVPHEHEPLVVPITLPGPKAAAAAPPSPIEEGTPALAPAADADSVARAQAILDRTVALGRQERGFSKVLGLDNLEDNPASLPELFTPDQPRAFNPVLMPTAVQVGLSLPLMLGRGIAQSGLAAYKLATGGVSGEIDPHDMPDVALNAATWMTGLGAAKSAGAVDQTVTSAFGARPRASVPAAADVASGMPKYPMAPRDRWYGDANYQQTGGRLTEMTPDEFLAQARPMKIDEVARENIDDLKAHIQNGGELDPLALYNGGKEDGRHRAIAAKELGMDSVPVLTWGDRPPFAGPNSGSPASGGMLQPVSHDPFEVAGEGRLGIGGNQPPPDMRLPLLRQDEPFSTPIDALHPQEQALTANDILHPDTPAPYAPRSRNVEDIAAELHGNAQDALKALGVRSGQITGPNPVTDELLARNLASEAKAEIDRGGESGAITALDWYSKKIDNGMAVASTIHPELETDPHAAMAYKAALSITSQGEAVPANTRLADFVYNKFKETGRFPTNVQALKGPSMNNNFAKLNGLLDTLGPEGTMQVLNEVKTAGEWGRLGMPIKTELAGTPVHGSGILGPKIGGGFYQNLSGNFDPATFDLWWMRRHGRTTGTLVGLADTGPQRARLEAELGKAAGDTSLPPAIQKLAAMPVPQTQPALLRRATAIQQAHEQDYTRNRALYESGERDKSNLAKAAIAYREGLQGLNEAPTGGAQRQWMRAIMARARSILAEEHGLHMSNADLQAVVWYPEKRLYGKLGGEPSEGLNVDYETAHRDLAREKGVPDERIQEALDRAERRRGGGDVSGAGEGVRQGLGEGQGQQVYDPARGYDPSRSGLGGTYSPPPPNPYRGRSPEGNQGQLAPDVLALHTPAPGSNLASFHEMNPAAGGHQSFHDAIAAAKAAHPNGTSVTLYGPQDYAGMRTFLTPDRSAGFALNGDDIVSVFKHPNSPLRGQGLRAADSILDMATAQGGRRLDAFDTALPHIYSDHGFKAVARLPWDDAHAPAGWDYEATKKYNGGRPDVVFMAHDPHGVANYSSGDGRKVASYAQGNKLQKKALDTVDMRQKAADFAEQWRRGLMQATPVDHDPFAAQ